MTPPIWQTPAGTLGTIPEGRFYKLALQASSTDSDVKFRLLAGSLPPGIQVKINGTLEGIPEAVAITQGVPLAVSENVTSKFTVRAYVESGDTVVVADRTFLLTVTGQDAPRFITPSGSLGSYLDSTQVRIPLDIKDIDDDTLTVSVVGGSLPPGLSVSDTAITGIIEPDTSLPDTAAPGFEKSEYDQYPFDFSTLSVSKNYQFTLEVSDGKQSDRRQFSIYVHSRNSLPLPAGITVSNDPSDIRLERAPFIISSTDLGRFRHDNFFASYITTVDFDGDPTEIEWVSPLSGSDPAGIDLLQDAVPGDATPPMIDTDLFIERLRAGWIQGWIPNLGVTEVTHEFTVRPYKKSNPTIYGPEYTFTLTFYGDIDTGVTWNVPQDLGTIYTGVPSTLYISATSSAGYELTYELTEDSEPAACPTFNNHSLPAGLVLLPTGEIAGATSFKQFKLDGGTTTLDSDYATRRGTDPVTFDRTYTFGVRITDPQGIVDVSRTFTIVVADSAAVEWEKVYMQAFLSLEDRARLFGSAAGIMRDADVFEPKLIYRAGDWNFGVARSLQVDHVFGVKSVELDAYVDALALSHYRKQLILGPLKTARALDENKNIVYEVIYAEIADPLVTAAGTSVSTRVRIPSMANRPVDASGNLVTGVYPNSLLNMKHRIENTIGTEYPVLPLWMRSVQEDGSVLGFTSAWVLAYANPGAGQQLLYNIVDRYGNIFNEIDAQIDRYVIAKGLTYPEVEPADPECSVWQPDPTNSHDKYAIFPKQGLIK